MREIYFDNSATTRISPGALDAVNHAMTEAYGNPSSVHTKGMQAEKLVRESREKIAATLHCSPKEIFFTSGGTESDNWALVGTALAKRRAGHHLITSSVEHAAILQTMHFLEDQGFRVTYLPVDGRGRIRLEDLQNALCDETTLVSLMYVNNEVGTIEPVEEAAALVKARCPGATFHTDAVQAYGKIPIRPGKTDIDLMSVSGHKFHGPKGTGVLYVKERTKLLPFIYGGGQQGGMRSGTDNVPGIAGIGTAAEEACERLTEHADHMRGLCSRLIDGISSIEDVHIITPRDEGLCAPHIVNASFPGIRSEVLIHALEDEGIFVSGGSACSSHKKLPVSPVLEQLGLPRNVAEAAIRFSFCPENTAEEVDAACEALGRLVPALRRYTRR